MKGAQFMTGNVTELEAARLFAQVYHDTQIQRWSGSRFQLVSSGRWFRLCPAAGGYWVKECNEQENAA